jgi:transposase-like protein
VSKSGTLTRWLLFCQNLRFALRLGRERKYIAGQIPEGWRLPEKRVVSPDELLSALKRYLAESGDTEEAVASQIGVNHHTLRRWLSDKQSPKKGKLALAAAFLRHAGYL